MTMLCFLDDGHRRYTSGLPEPTKCGRILAGVTPVTIPLRANATRDRSLVSCPACLAKLVDDALTDPLDCPECLGTGDTSYASNDYKRCGVCNGTGRAPSTGRLTASQPNIQNLPRPK